MKVYYDIHIHSILSACADELQTPNNILNMAMLKELSLISITDHNSLKQYEVIDKLKSSFDFLIIYGVEITVKEGFHVLGYFPTFQAAFYFDNYIDQQLDRNQRNFKHIGEQIVCDEYDLENYQIDYYLNQPIQDDFNSITKVIRSLDGVIVLAHVDRLGTSILKDYQDLSQFDFDAIELSTICNHDEFFKRYPSLKQYKVLKSSDAHSLEIINEKVNYLDLEELSFSEFKKWIKS